MKHSTKIILLGFFLLLVMTLVGINYVAPRAITQPPKVTNNATPEDYDLQGDTLNLLTTDSIRLKGYHIHSDSTTAKGVIILIHGIGGCKEHFLGLTQELASKGIESVLFDSRAHGRSEGKYCTYGAKEKEDLVQIVDWVEAERPDLPIGIWGNSLGGAIAIQALERDERIAFGVIESTFTHLPQIVYDYQQRLSNGLGTRWLSDHALARAGALAGFDPAQVSPLQSVQAIEQPVLIAHGEADENISVDYGKALFAALKSQDKELALVPEGGHFGLFKTGGESYKNKIWNFIERQLP